MVASRKQVLFLIQEPLMADHYREIWKKLDSRKFVIGLCQRMDSGSEEFDPETLRYSNELRESGYTLMDFSELRSSAVIFQWVVSHHKLGRAASTKTLRQSARDLLNRVSQSPTRKGHRLSFPRMLVQRFRRPTWAPQEVGNIQIRMMYGADVNAAWSLQDWNEMYSYFLCHGPLDSELFRQRFNGVCFEIGYPKYDRHFLERDSLIPLREAFGLASEPKVILWLPTAKDNSLDEFFDLISALTDHYQVICRPHPLSIRSETESVKKLYASRMKVDTYDSREMVDLLDIADYLFADTGGSPFGGLYLNMRVVRLVGPNSAGNALAVDATNDMLEDLYPAISPRNSVDSVTRLLENEDLWDEIRGRAKEMRSRVFGDYDGHSADRVVSVLEQITGLTLGVAKIAQT